MAHSDAPEAQSHVPSTSPDEDDFSPRWQGPIRRNLGLILALIAIVAVGPALSRVLESYRAIVLEVADDQMLLGYAHVPPEWVDAIEAQEGTVIAKTTWSWDPAPTQVEPTDRALVDLYERYALTYSGTIVEILPPPSQGGTASAMVETDNGSQEIVKLVADHLLEAAAGDRVAKKTHTWDPEIVKRAAPGATKRRVSPKDP
jgi:hypothetical protein